jgi:heptosyltransferase-1
MRLRHAAWQLCNAVTLPLCNPATFPRLPRSMRILILKPSSLGDVVHALPVLRLLKQHRPEAEIYWWLEASLVPLLEDDPDLTEIIPFERRRWATPRHWPEAWRSLRRLRHLSFDWVIDLQSLARSGAVAWLTNGAFTIGLDDAREGARGFYDVAIARPSPQTHAVDWYLQVLPALGVPVHRQFTWLPERPQVSARVLEQWNGAGAPWVALQPGARWDNKRWPVEHFARLVREPSAALAEARFIILGGRADQSLGQAIAAANPDRCLDLTGKTSLPETIEWLRRCSALITNDTGPMHLAAALGTPVLALFGPTDPRRTGPYGSGHRVLRQPLPCAPCMKDSCANAQPLECLRAIPPARVADAVAELLSHSPAARLFNA